MPVTVGPKTLISATGFGAQIAEAVRPTAGPGRVAFSTAQPRLRVVCKLGAESATPGGGVGGWQSLELAGRADAIEFGSTPGRTLSIPILLDGLTELRSVEADIEMLYLMGRPPERSPRGTLPPVVRVGGMVPGTGREWVIGSIDEGKELWDGRQMSRVQIWATVNLLEYALAEVVVIRRSSASGKAAKSSGTYTVRRGDTLASIARDRMGASTATLIAAAVRALKELNKIRDPKSIRPGDTLRIPAVTDTVGPRVPG